MLTAKDQAERVELWTSLGNQPGTGHWFTVWVVSRRKRAKRPAPAALKRLKPEICRA